MNKNGTEGLPPSWVETTLDELRFDHSQSIVPSKWPNENFELYSVPSFDLKTPEIIPGRKIGSNKQTVETDTVLLCKINPRINRVWVVGNYSPCRKIASTEWISFFRVGDLLPKYLCYYMRMEEFRNYLSSQASGVGGSLMRIRASTFACYSVPLAPLPEQHRIVAEIEKQFTRLDAAVAALERARANLKRYRASVLKAACEGRLVPTESELACAEGRDYEPADRLLTRILRERRAKWEAGQLAKVQAQGKVPKDDKWKAKYQEPAAPDTTDLPEPPEGWMWARLDQLLGFLRNGISTKPDAEAGVPILRISAVRPMSVNMQDVRFLAAASDDFADYILIPGDLLFTRYNGNPALVGVCGVVRTVPRKTVHPDKLIRGKVACDLCLPSFLETVLNVGASRDFLARRIRTTAGQAGISGGDLRNIPFPLPPLAEQHRIIAEVERRLSVIDELEASVDANLKRAERLRQSILKRAFEGKLVPQDPNDESARVLLERIRAERAGREAEQKATRKATGKPDAGGKRPQVLQSQGELFR